MRTLTDIIHDLEAEDCEAADDAIASAVLAYLKVRNTAADTLRPLVAREVSLVRRHRVRVVETRAFSKRNLTGDAPTDLVVARRDLAEATFVPGIGQKPVAWADATAEQHLARIAMLEQHVAGTVATIDRHRAAVDLIADAGVSCLREIEGWAA